MDREETLKLLASGQDAWRSWATVMQRRRTDLEQTNRWETHPDGQGRNDETRAWLRDAASNFSSKELPHTFDEDVDLSGLEFPGYANFEAVTFKGVGRFSRSRFLTFTNFQSACFCNETDFDDARFSGVHPSEITNVEGANRIPNARFSRNVDFTNARFHGKSGFRKVVFERTVWFNRAVFFEDVWFRQVKFAGDAPFWSAQFCKDAWFLEASFDNEAWFRSTSFNGDANFTQVDFSGGATFDSANFGGSAIFRAAQCHGAFSFESTYFCHVPDFIQAHFSEAPHFDNIKIANLSGQNTNLASRFRALKRIAIQGHDYAREHEFFVGELKSMRGYLDTLGPNPLNWLRLSALNTTNQSRRILWRWSRLTANEREESLPVWPGGVSGSLRYWFGLGYQWLSNFGRSLILPPVWWTVSTIAFASLYLGFHDSRSNFAITRYDAFVSVLADWARHLGLSRMSIYFSNLSSGISPTPTCIAGPGDPFWAALGLSIRKALVFTGIDSPEKLNQLYACLYGLYPLEDARPGILPDRFVPIIPDTIAFTGVLQFMFSALLVFLFFLAVRNHFRIK